MAERQTDPLSTRSGDQLPATEAPPCLNDWQALGTTFEGMTKAGLALTIGFSVAAAFCRLVDTGKIKIPDLLGTLARSSLPPEPPSRRGNGG
jgi:hypothetical protein